MIKRMKLSTKLKVVNYFSQLSDDGILTNDDDDDGSDCILVCTECKPFHVSNEKVLKVSGHP